MKAFVWANTPERGLFCRTSFSCSPFAVQERRVWQCGAALTCETDTTNDNKSEWWLSMPNWVSTWKVIPRALFAMVRRFEQEYAAQGSGILCLLLLRNRSLIGPRRWQHFLHPSCFIMSMPVCTTSSINLYVFATSIPFGAQRGVGGYFTVDKMPIFLFSVDLISHFLMLRETWKIKMRNDNQFIFYRYILNKTVSFFKYEYK